MVEDVMSENESKHAYQKKTAWETFTTTQIKDAYGFCESYKTFLNTVKTEREAVTFIISQAKKQKKLFFENY